jgi:hypothetical protein
VEFWGTKHKFGNWSIHGSSLYHIQTTKLTAYGPQVMREVDRWDADNEVQSE